MIPTCPVMMYHHDVHRIRIADVIIIILYISIVVASIAFFPEGGDTLYVSTESGEYAYSLDEDGTYQFSGPLGITTLEISDGRARIIDSPCSGKDCIRQGYSSVLCCMPNRIIATVRNTEGLDAEAG